MTSVYPPYLSSTFITVPPDTLGKIIIAPLASDYCTGPYESCLIFQGQMLGPGGGLFFAAQDITSPGTYYDQAGFGSLTITDLSLAAAPEPSSLALLGTGVLGVAETLRRRRQA